MRDFARNHSLWYVNMHDYVYVAVNYNGENQVD